MSVIRYDVFYNMAQNQFKSGGNYSDWKPYWNSRLLPMLSSMLAMKLPMMVDRKCPMWKGFAILGELYLVNM